MGPRMKVKREPASLVPVSKVEPELFADVDVVAQLEVERAGRAPAAQFHVAVFVAAHWHALVRQVGHGQQQVLQLGLDHLQPRGGGLKLGLERRHLRHGRIGLGVLALALEHADLLGQRVALALQVLGAGLQRLALGFQRLVGGHIQVGLRLLAGLQARHDPVEVFSQLNDV